MTNINESESVDLLQVKNTRRSMVNKCMKSTFNAAKILSISEKNLSKSTGYHECQDFNVKVNDLISYYESMSTKSRNPLKNVILPIKRKSAILEGISILETNKLSQVENGSVQISNPVSEKIRKNFEETNCIETEYYNVDSSLYEYYSCSDVFQTKSYELMNDNFSLPNYDCLNHSYAEHFNFDNEFVCKRQEQLDSSNPVSSENVKFTHWEISNKNKFEEDQLFANNRESLFVMHDKKGRINGYHVKLQLSISEEVAEKDLDADELKALDVLSRHSRVEEHPVDFDKSEEVNKIAYTNFKYPSLDLAEDLLRCTKCDLTPHYYQVVRRLFDCARLGDFTSLAEKQKVLNAARSKRKAEESEKAKKRPKRAASKPVSAPAPVQAPGPVKTYSFKRKASKKSKQVVKKKKLTKSNQIEPNVNVIVPIENIVDDVNENVPAVKNIETVPTVNECNIEVKRDVELKKINTNLFDDKRAELISMGLLPSCLATNPLYDEESEVSKFVKTELTSMGILPAKTNCALLKK